MVKTSKLMPYLALALGSLMFGIDTFTEYQISAEAWSFAQIILTPLGLGGLVKRAIDKRSEIANIVTPKTIEAIKKIVEDLKK